MNLGSMNTRSVVNEASALPQKKPKRHSSGYRKIMSRSRISEEDLEALYQDIQKTHRKKNLQVLARTGIIFSILLIIILWFF